MKKAQALLDRLTAFNNRHKARAEEKRASNREVFKDNIIKSVQEAQNVSLPQFQGAIETICQALIKGEAKKHTTDVAAKITTLEKQLLEENNNLREYIQDRHTKLQVQIEAAANDTKDLEEKLLQRHDTTQTKIDNQDGKLQAHMQCSYPRQIKDLEDKLLQRDKTLKEKVTGKVKTYIRELSHQMKTLKSDIHA